MVIEFNRDTGSIFHGDATITDPKGRVTLIFFSEEDRVAGEAMLERHGIVYSHEAEETREISYKPRYDSQVASLIERVGMDIEHDDAQGERVLTFSSLEKKEAFGRMLTENSVPYKHTPVVPGPVWPVIPKVRSRDGVFINDSSEDAFVLGYKSIDDVIAADARELSEIGGSFEAIADRMDQILGIGKSKGTTYPIDLGYDIVITGEMGSRGQQWCPFTGCEDGIAVSDYFIENRRTGRKLTINELTSHLARDHKLLEKGNQYGITAAEFYEHFIPKEVKAQPQ